MRLIQSLFLSAALLAPSVAGAAPDPGAPLPSEIRLSDEEKEKVLEAAAAGKREHAVAISEDEAPQPPQIHGEVGFTLGSDGYRSIYGTAFGPLGGDGFGAISLEGTDFGNRRRDLDPLLR